MRPSGTSISFEPSRVCSRSMVTPPCCSPLTISFRRSGGSVSTHRKSRGRATSASMRCSVRRAYRVKAAAVGGVSSVAETAAYETRQSATASFLAITDECAIGEYSGSVDHAENQNFLHFVPGARGADRTQLQAIFVGGQGRKREVELVDAGRQWFRDRLQLPHGGATAVEQARRDHRLRSGRAIGRHAHEQALGAAERA